MIHGMKRGLRSPFSNQEDISMHLYIKHRILEIFIWKTFSYHLKENLHACTDLFDNLQEQPVCDNDEDV